MTIGAHLTELRKRLVRSAAALLVGSVAGWFIADPVMAALRGPVTAIALGQHRNASLNFPDITGAFDLKMQIAITVGAVLSSPVWLYQVFAFIVPGLTGRERRYTFGFFLSAVPLFLAGCAAGWYVVPHIVSLMTAFASTQDAALIDASPYYSFVLKLVLAIGIAFVLPVFLVLLNFMGVLSARSIVKSWRVALILIVLFTAIATPSADVASMFLLAVPMVALYFAAAGVSWLHDRRVAKRARSLDDAAIPAAELELPELSGALPGERK
ncbi:twin-arginine translocase subunit TatC [Diaminobutyricibacter sp. McL0618]|uniref:twin-arginine translocase subunit TatC n=1 Tax=Leifsonia sp. McL0618 TaxID=3415677 RepID=UPI003CFAAE32